MNTMNAMNMANMGAMGGGPVGGGMAMMNNGGPMNGSNSGAQDELRRRLNTYIYDYFLKLGYHDMARNLHRDEKFEMNTKDAIKRSPGRRKDIEVNGVDGDAMDMDGKDDIPDDLPRPALPQENPGHGFLFDWFALFHEIFSAQRTKSGPGDQNAARQYIQQTQNIQRLRESQQNPKYPGPGMTPSAAHLNAMRRNGMLPNEMQQKMAQSMSPQQIQAMQNRQMAAKQQQMQREHSDMGMNGQRPGTPGDGDNTASPSKRPRLDQQFPGGMMPNGRGQGMPNGAQSMLMQSGFHPNSLNSAQLRQNGAMQAKAMQNQLAMNNAMMGMPTNGSPTMHPMPDPSHFPNGMPMEMYRPGMPGQGMPGGPGGQGGGNHALQDYQMQLMLLEQQNKKRLMMARQEQDSNTRGDGGPVIPGQVGMQPPGMSPSGSRTGTSPNPVDQMKRGTPQMGGMPGSPAAGDLRDGSPAGMHFMNGIPPPTSYEQGMFMNQKDGMMPGAPGMRPLNAMDISMAQRAQQQGRMNQYAGGQPMAQQSSQGQPQPMGTPGQRNEMPPPPGPASNGQNAQRAAPGSPQPGQAPPTPSQTNKANPKGKKGKEGDTRKRPTKKNSTANAPSADGEPPATPTPPAPITPVHPNPFTNSGGKAGNGTAVGNPAPTSNPSMAVAQPQISQNDMSSAAAFGEFSTTDQAFNLDFSTLENPDVLENFDFDSFLNTDPESFNFDPTSMGGTDYGMGDPVPE